MMNKEYIESEISKCFAGKEIAVEQKESGLFTIAVADMVYHKDGYFDGWSYIMAKVDIDINNHNSLHWCMHQLEDELRERMQSRINTKKIKIINQI